MDSIYDIRRENLRRLIADRFAGSQTEFARAVGLEQPSFVSRLLTDRDSARKNIGQRLARRIEAALGLVPNSLDTPTPGNRQDDDSRDIPRESRSYSSPLAGEITPEQGRALLGQSKTVRLLTPAELGRLDAIESAYEPNHDYESVVVRGEAAAPHAVALRLTDDAMAERFPVGSIIVISADKTPKANDFVVGVMPGETVACLRQWLTLADRHFLLPKNPNYPAHEAGPDFRLLGVVVEATTFF